MLKRLERKAALNMLDYASPLDFISLGIRSMAKYIGTLVLAMRLGEPAYTGRATSCTQQATLSLNNMLLNKSFLINRRAAIGLLYLMFRTF